MKQFILPQYSWMEFLAVGLALLAGYLLLRFLSRMLPRMPLPAYLKTPLKAMLHYSMLVYEPLAGLLWLSAFVLINPLVNDFVVVLLLLGGFSQVRNYLSGRLVQLGNYMATGRRLRTHELEGRIFRMRRLGLDLQTPEGRHFIGYNRLLSEGFTLISGEEVGGFYRLVVMSEKLEGPAKGEIPLLDLLATAPYLDSSYKPMVVPSPDDPEVLDVRLLVKEEKHLQDLLSLMKEWGYSVKIAD